MTEHTPNASNHPSQPPPSSPHGTPPRAPGALGSLICGICAIFVFPIGLIAVILGHSAQGKIKRSQGTLGGGGFATAGLVLGYLFLVLGILVAAIIVPAMTNVLVQTKLTDMKSNGKNIYVSVFADAVEGGEVGYPSLEYKTSSQYFRVLAGQEQGPDASKVSTVINIGPDFYAGPHTGSASSWAEFGPGNNGWCLIPGFDEGAEAGTPFMISGNLTVRNTSELTGPIANTIDASMKGYGGKVVIAYHGGGAQLTRKGATWEEYLPAGPMGDHIILHP